MTNTDNGTKLQFLTARDPSRPADSSSRSPFVIAGSSSNPTACLQAVADQRYLRSESLPAIPASKLSAIANFLVLLQFIKLAFGKPRELSFPIPI